jgi:hypothetical protein
VLHGGVIAARRLIIAAVAENALDHDSDAVKLTASRNSARSSCHRSAARSGTVVPHDAPAAIDRSAFRPRRIPRDETLGRFEDSLEFSELCRAHSFSFEKRADPPNRADVTIAQRDPNQLRGAGAGAGHLGPHPLERPRQAVESRPVVHGIN